MDLVASYKSDDESSSKTSQSSKKIDVIEIEDSDSDSETRLSSKTKSLNSAVKPIKENKPNTSKEIPQESSDGIECIDLDYSSDFEDDDNKKLNDETPEKLTSVCKSKNTNSEKVDYLHLNRSDSEDEQPVLEGVSNLLDSASVLNDIPCGPEKLDSSNGTIIDTVQNADNKEPDHTGSIPILLKNCDSSLQCDGKPKAEGFIDVTEKIHISTEYPLNKRIKRESETPKSTNTDVGENEEPFVQHSFMYRKDERINIAFSKSVVCRLPRQIAKHYINHVNVVTALQWCVPQFSHLLLSASADCTAKIWDMYCRNPVQNFKDILSLKAAKWSLSGEQVMLGGYGKRARVYDVLSGKEIISYDVFNYVSSLEIHPYMDDVFLCGTRNAIFGYDLRVNTNLPIRTFISKCDEILDIAFLDENEFICSTSVVSHDSADRTIMVWDFSTGAIMSNQVFLERYTCPSLKVHPHDSCFIAQTNGDYIAAFSSQKPYKIKDKRYMGHKVSGYGVECDISPDGKYIVSGDASGDIYFYSYANTSVVNKLTAKPNVATNRVKWHPALNSTVATATWDGHIQIWK